MSATGYHNPWVEIEPERIAAYDELFAWHPATAPLLEAADIGKGHVVGDFGCGPGHMAVELAKWVGRTGHVHAFDINAGFLALTLDKATAQGVIDRITLHQTDGYGLALSDHTLDRIVTRNTLVFADEPDVIFKEFRRVLRRGGKAHAIEGDWLFMAVEPVPTADWNAFVEAASHACRLPDVGRKLYRIARGAGFGNVAIDVMSRADTSGRLMPIIRNMAEYARLGGLAEATVARVLKRCEEAIIRDEFLAVAPQFVITASDGPPVPTGHWM